LKLINALKCHIIKGGSMTEVQFVNFDKFDKDTLDKIKEVT
jgi:hypothetical protein